MKTLKHNWEEQSILWAIYFVALRVPEYQSDSHYGRSLCGSPRSGLGGILAFYTVKCIMEAYTNTSLVFWYLPYHVCPPSVLGERCSLGRDMRRDRTTDSSETN